MKEKEGYNIEHDNFEKVIKRKMVIANNVEKDMILLSNRKFSNKIICTLPLMELKHTNTTRMQYLSYLQ
jgi:hypothetical protein